MANQPSTYFFIARLTDPQARFRVQGEKLSGGLQLAVFWDAIVASGATLLPFPDFRRLAGDALDLVVAAYVFKTKKALDYRLENWVEAQNVSTDGVIGRFMLPNQTIPHLAPARSTVNTPWKKAARLERARGAGQLTHNHVLALRDYQLAQIDPSDNAFQFAWRAVEDICRAVTGLPDVSPAAWITMNQTLGTTQQQTDPLNNAAIAIRHNVMSPARQAQLAAAKANRSATLDIAHTVIAAEMRRIHSWF